MENSTLYNFVPPQPIITKLGMITSKTHTHMPSFVKFRWVGNSFRIGEICQ